LALFSLFLYIQSKRLKSEDFQFPTMINDADEIDVDGNDQRPIVTGRRTGNKDH
jgi:hypothetical protein